jgi:ATP-binding cassette, subfamily C, bacterial CydD
MRAPPPAGPDTARWLTRQAAAARGWLALSVAAGFMAGLLVIAQAGLFAWIAHGAVVDGLGLDDMRVVFIALAGVFLGSAVARWTQQAAGIAAGARIRREIRGRLLDHLTALGPVHLADRHSAGIASQVLEQVEALDGYYARFLPQVLLAILVPLAMLAAVLSQDWLAAAILLVSAPLVPFFMVLVGLGAERLAQQQFHALTRLSGHFLDRVRGLVTLRLFGQAGRAVAEVHAVSDDLRRRTLRTLRVAFLSSAVLEFFSSVAIAVVAIYVGFGLLGYIHFGPAPELTLFSGLFILLLVPELFQPLRTLAQHFHERAAAVGAADGLLALLAHAPPATTPRPPRVCAQPRSVTPPASRMPRAGRGTAAPSIETPEPVVLTVEGVRVCFAGRKPALDGVSLRVRQGECLVLAGPSGAGKSTLLHLLAGFVSPTAGRVTIAGGPPGLPGQLAWVGQRPFLLHGSVADNIRLGRADASAAEVHTAAGQAGVLEFAGSLPRGLDTLIGERGYGLSGGQAQRVALARAFLSRAPLLLLDEPTASLDASSEARVLAALGRLAGTGRTLVAASHHPAVHRMADRVVYLEQGRLLGEETFCRG